MLSWLLAPLYLVTVPAWVAWQAAKACARAAGMAVSRMLPTWIVLTALYLLFWLLLSILASGTLFYFHGAWRFENWSVGQIWALMHALDRWCRGAPLLDQPLHWWMTTVPGPAMTRLTWHYWGTVAALPIVGLAVALPIAFVAALKQEIRA